jgi:phosphoribosyl 1,2-cyclic phosphate phosphodiesterase
MRVHILGTGAAEGFPALFCECATCGRARAAKGKNLRSRLCLRIDEDLLIDFPPDAVTQAHRNGFSLAGIRHLLVTHSHRDHFAPGELHWRDEPFAVWEEKPALHVYGVPHVGEVLRAAFDDDPAEHGIEYHIVRPFTSFQAGSFEVTPIEATHAPERGAVNYILSSRGGRNGLIAFDTGWYGERSWSALNGWKFDLVVMECTNGGC